MSQVATEPVVGEQVESSDPVVTDTDSKPKKRGRKSADDDTRMTYTPREGMLDERGKIKEWPEDSGFRFGADDDCHIPLKKDMFLNDEVFVDYKIARKLWDRAIIDEEISELKRTRELTAGIEDEVSKEQTKQALKKVQQLEKLKKELAEKGIDINSLIAQAT